MQAFIQKQSGWYRVINSLILFCFFISSVTVSVPSASAQTSQAVLNLPNPAFLLGTTPAYTPALITGVNIDADNPLRFDFIINEGDQKLDAQAFNDETMKLIKYFLAALTTPESEMWVNLSPYEKDRIIPAEFGKTEMGRDLLAQDYLLKQLSASLMYPESDLGKAFWKKISKQVGTTDLSTLSTFNKVWIVPQEAKIYEHSKGAFIVKTHLKVMLEEDYLALEANQNSTKHGLGTVTKEELKSGLNNAAIREVIIPAIEKEVNEGSTFATLRQIYNSVILATWYKQALKNSLLGQGYVNRHKTNGVAHNDPEVAEKIYQEYLKAFQVGAYDYIKEEYNPETQQVESMKYISGGVVADVSNAMLTVPGNENTRQVIEGQVQSRVASVELFNNAMLSADSKLIPVEIKESELKKLLGKLIVLDSGSAEDSKLIGGHLSELDWDQRNGLVSFTLNGIDYTFTIPGAEARSSFPDFGGDFKVFAVEEPKEESDEDLEPLSPDANAMPFNEVVAQYRKPVIGYNLKGEFLLADVDKLLDGIADDYQKDPVDPNSVQVIAAFANGHLQRARQKIDELVAQGRIPKGFIKLGAQNVRAQGLGAYTGYALSINELKDLGVEVVILGHSELTTTDLGDPRVVETDEQVNEKVHVVIDGGLELILAYGETKAQRDAGETKPTLKRQLGKRLKNVTPEKMIQSNAILAYEPVWAIGKGGTPAKKEDAEAVAEFSRQWVNDYKGPQVAARTVIQYGGSMKPENVDELSKMPNIDGGLIGGASKKAETAAPIYRTFAANKKDANNAMVSDADVEATRGFMVANRHKIWQLDAIAGHPEAQGITNIAAALDVLVRSGEITFNATAQTYAVSNASVTAVITFAEATKQVEEHWQTAFDQKQHINPTYLETLGARIDVSRNLLPEHKAEEWDALRSQLDRVIEENPQPNPAMTAINYSTLTSQDAQTLKAAEQKIKDILKAGFDAGDFTKEIYETSLNNTYQNLALWTTDPDIHRLSPGVREANLKAIREGRWADVIEAYRAEVPFGTAGIRGFATLTQDELLMLHTDGPSAAILKGTNTINDITLLKKTQAVIKMMKANGQTNVQIGYDSRIAGQQFAEMLARQFIAASTPEHMFKIFLFDEASPFPELSFGVTTENADSDWGIFISASHNPRRYNGYKITRGNGAQLNQKWKERVLASDAEVKFSEIQVAGSLADAREGQLVWLGGSEQLEGKEYYGFPLIDMHSQHIAQVKKFLLDTKLIDNFGKLVKIGFAAYNGSGYKAVPRLLRETGFPNFNVVSSMQTMDGMFPAFNPEEQPDPGDPIAGDVAVREFIKEHGQETFDDLDAVIGTDPDADRMGLTLKVPKIQQKYLGRYRLLPANDAWTLLLWYRLMKKQQLGMLDPAKSRILASHVTTDALEATGELFGVKSVGDMMDKTGKDVRGGYLNGRRTWVGFTYLGDWFERLAEEGLYAEAGAEESNGFSIQGHVLDKDGTFAAILIAEVLAFAKQQGTTGMELLDDIYRQIGFYATANKPLPRVGSFKGAAGVSEKIKMVQKAEEWMKQANERAGTNNPLMIAGREVIGAVSFGSNRVDHLHYKNIPDEGIRFFFKDEVNAPKDSPFTQSRNYVTLRISGTSQTIRAYTQLWVKFDVEGEEAGRLKAQKYAEAEAVSLLAQAQLIKAVNLQDKHLAPVIEQLDTLNRQMEEIGLDRRLTTLENAGNVELAVNLAMVSQLISEMKKLLVNHNESSISKKALMLLDAISTKSIALPVAQQQLQVLLEALSQAAEKQDGRQALQVNKGSLNEELVEFIRTDVIGDSAMLGGVDVAELLLKLHKAKFTSIKNKLDEIEAAIKAEKFRPLTTEDLTGFLSDMPSDKIISALDRWIKLEEFVKKNSLQRQIPIKRAQQLIRSEHIVRLLGEYGYSQELIENIRELEAQNKGYIGDFLQAMYAEALRVDVGVWLIANGIDLVEYIVRLRANFDSRLKELTDAEGKIIKDKINWKISDWQKTKERGGWKAVFEVADFINSGVFKDPDSRKAIKKQYTGESDDAVLATEAPGGIDLNPMINSLEIKNVGDGFVLPPIDPAMLEQLQNASGLFPVIINVAPANLPLLLGLADQPVNENPVDFSQDKAPMDRRESLSKLN